MRNHRLREEVAAYCKAERQWPRHVRIHHAERMREQQPERSKFWSAVLKAQGAK